MNNITALITVRSKSSRLPEKCFLPFGSGTVIEHIIARAEYFGIEPVLCTTEDKSDDRLVEIAEKCKIRFYRGSAKNKLMRWRDCCRALNIDAFHTIDADDPFFCGEEVLRSFELLNEGYDMVTPTPSSSSGGATVGYSLRYKLISRACKGLNNDSDTEMMWTFIERLKNVKSITLEEPKKFQISARMTLDYHEDYIFLEALRLIAGSFASRKDLYLALEENPSLKKINGFRTDEWKKNQEMKFYQRKKNEY